MPASSLTARCVSHWGARHAGPALRGGLVGCIWSGNQHAQPTEREERWAPPGQYFCVEVRVTQLSQDMLAVRCKHECLGKRGALAAAW